MKAEMALSSRLWGWLVVMWAALTPCTALGSVALAGAAARWIVAGSGVPFYRSEQPDLSAGFNALAFAAAGAVAQLTLHLRWLGARSTLPRFRQVAGQLLWQHLLISLLSAAIALAVVFAHGIPQAGRLP